ncbi:MAG: hypothetical protein M3N34_08660 [Pseudomonadota bacterium]|nr:hypothetical protein [Pseudomonadota bacterium]
MFVKSISLLVLVAASASNALATEAPMPLTATTSQTGLRQITMAPNTEISVTPNDTLSSKSIKVGDKFRISTVFDVMQDGFVMIPRGTYGEGTVSYRTGKGAFGKSAKFEVTFDWLDLNGRHIPLTGKYRAEGEGNTGAAVGAVVAVGVFGAFVTGHSATITNGQQLRAYTAEPLAFNVPGAAVATPMATLSAPPPVAAPAAQTVATSVTPVALKK